MKCSRGAAEDGGGVWLSAHCRVRLIRRVVASATITHLIISNLYGRSSERPTSMWTTQYIMSKVCRYKSNADGGLASAVRVSADGSRSSTQGCGRQYGDRQGCGRFVAAGLLRQAGLRQAGLRQAELRQAELRQVCCGGRFEKRPYCKLLIFSLLDKKRL